MATTTPLPMPDPAHELFSSPALQVVEDMDRGCDLQGPEPDRSSSLSDIGDRAEENMAQPERTLAATDSDPNDTEAETERLEDSPQKLRENQNLVHTAANFLYHVSDQTALQNVAGM